MSDTPAPPPQVNYDELQQAAVPSAALPDEPAVDTAEKVSSSVSLVLMMTLAACLGFGIMQIDLSALSGDQPGGARKVVWRNVMKRMGVDIKEYRAQRVQQYGADAQFADDGAISDLQMFITDAMGPRD